VAVAQPDPPVPPEEQWPSVPLAYEFVRPSYDIMLRRFETVEGRIRALVTLTGTLTFAAPVFARSVRPDIPLASLWFILAASAAILVVGLGVVATVFWTVRLYDPCELYEKYLEWTAWEFQKNMLYWAGDAFKRNAASLRRKAGLADAMALFFLAEISFLVVWGLTAA
jgi:hypothetical protein